MSFGFGSQSPFSPGSSPNWGFQASQPAFGAQLGSSPFRVSSGSSSFLQSSTGFGATSTSGSGFGNRNLFGVQSSGSWFASPSSGGWFSAQSSTTSFFPQSTSAFIQPRTTQQWTLPQQQHHQPSHSPFRDDFYKVVQRADKRPVTNYTRIDELVEHGQCAIRMIQDEQAKYKSIREEILNEPWFKRETNTEDINNAFKEELSKLRQQMKEHRMDVDIIGQDLKASYPRADLIDQAIRDANHVISELDKLINPQITRGRLVQSELQYQTELEVPHPFIVSKAMELGSRLEALLSRLSDAEQLQGTDDSNTNDTNDDIASYELVLELSNKLSTALDRLSSKIQSEKELFLATEYRRYGSGSDPFAEASKEDRIRENEIFYGIHQTRPMVLQASTSVEPGSGQSILLGPGSGTAPFGFGASSGPTSFQQSSTGNLFQSSGPSAFIMPSTKPPQSSLSTAMFGKTSATGSQMPSSGGLFAASTGGFGAFSSTGGRSPVQQSGGGLFAFGSNTGASGFASPGSSISTNFGSSTFNASPSGRSGFRNNGNRSL